VAAAMALALAAGLAVAAGAASSAAASPGVAAVRTTLGSCPVFPKDNAWNKDISKAKVHKKSAAWVKSIGTSGHLHPDFGTSWDGAPIGIPYITVTNTTAKVPVTFQYKSESDKGPYPIPKNAPIEGGSKSTGDRHVIVINTSTCTLYELWNAKPVNGGTSWKAGSGAVFNLKSNKLRPAGWTSADAAGLPIFPGLVRYDEVKAGVIKHALRFTVSKTQKGYIAPARHFASSSTNANLPPMGARFRLKASYSCAKYSKEVQVICAALKKYGMIVADNGSNWYVSGTHDTRWNDAHLNDLKKIPGSAFEAVDTGAKIVTK
jgi:hypothetical protein